MRVVVKRIGGDHRGLRFELDLPDAAPSIAGDSQSTAVDGRPSGAPGLAELTSLIAKKTEIPEWAQRVFYQGRYLHGQGSLADKGVPAEGAVLLLATSAHYREPMAAGRAEALPSAADELGPLPASSSSAATSAGGASPLLHEVPYHRFDGSERMQEAPLPQAAPASLAPTPPAPATEGDPVASEISSGDASSSRVAASASSATPDTPNATASEDLSKLSVAELKQRLNDRGVCFAGCTEKSDLLELLRNAPARPARQPPGPPQPKRPPPAPPMTSAPDLLSGTPFGAFSGAGNPPPGFVSVGMGPFATGGVLGSGNSAANLGVFLQQLGPAMDTVMSQAFAEVPMQPAQGDMGPAPEPPQHAPDGEANAQQMPTAQPPPAAWQQAAQGQEVPGNPTITMSFPAGAPPNAAINAMMQQLGPQLQQMLGPFSQLFGEQGGPPGQQAAGGMPQPGGEPQERPAPR